MRKHLSGYLKGLPHISKFRSEVMQHVTIEPVYEMLEKLRNTTMIRDLVSQSEYQDEPVPTITCAG